MHLARLLNYAYISTRYYHYNFFCYYCDNHHFYLTSYFRSDSVLHHTILQYTSHHITLHHITLHATPTTNLSTTTHKSAPCNATRVQLAHQPLTKQYNLPRNQDQVSEHDGTSTQTTYILPAIYISLILLFAVLIARFAFVMPATLLVNTWRKEKIHWREALVIWWGGAFRGAITVALVYSHF